MQLGMIGLGRMGANMVQRLMRAGHECVVYDRNPEAVSGLEAQGAFGTTNLDGFIASLDTPRAIWLMVPAAVVDRVIDELAPQLEAGDILIDGGNSYYRDDITRAAQLQARGIHYLDVGTSGGVWGLAGATFIVIGLLGLVYGGEFLAPLLGQGQMGSLLSAGTLPLLYIAVGLKVGTELAGLMAHIAAYEAVDS